MNKFVNHEYVKKRIKKICKNKCGKLSTIEIDDNGCKNGGLIVSKLN